MIAKVLTGAGVLLLATAPVAGADSFSYYGALADNGVTGGYVQLAEIGRNVCHSLRSNQSDENLFAVHRAVGSYGYSAYEAKMIISAAVYHLCPDQAWVYEP